MNNSSVADMSEMSVEDFITRGRRTARVCVCVCLAAFLQGHTAIAQRPGEPSLTSALILPPVWPCPLPLPESPFTSFAPSHSGRDGWEGGRQEITRILHHSSVKTKRVAFKEDWGTRALIWQADSPQRPQTEWGNSWETQCYHTQRGKIKVGVNDLR